MKTFNTEDVNLIATIFVTDNDNDTLSFAVCNDSKRIYIASDSYLQNEAIFTHKINNSLSIEKNANEAIQRFCKINKCSQNL